jgi:hypothetical protein
VFDPRTTLRRRSYRSGQALAGSRCHHR